jgi:hypothetical protein
LIHDYLLNPAWEGMEIGQDRVVTD